jgi:hypothetical protein
VPAALESAEAEGARRCFMADGGSTREALGGGSKSSAVEELGDSTLGCEPVASTLGALRPLRRFSATGSRLPGLISQGKRGLPLRPLPEALLRRLRLRRLPSVACVPSQAGSMRRARPASATAWLCTDSCQPLRTTPPPAAPAPRLSRAAAAAA